MKNLECVLHSCLISKQQQHIAKYSVSMPYFYNPVWLISQMFDAIFAHTFRGWKQKLAPVFSTMYFIWKTIFYTLWGFGENICHIMMHVVKYVSGTTEVLRCSGFVWLTDNIRSNFSNQHLYVLFGLQKAIDIICHGLVAIV